MTNNHNDCRDNAVNVLEGILEPGTVYTLLLQYPDDKELVTASGVVPDEESFEIEVPDNRVMIFKSNGLLMADDLEYVRKNIKKQIEDGVVVLNGTVDFVGYLGRND